MTAPERDVLEEVHELITALEAHSDPRVGEQVAALLERVDTVHRTALTHLMSAIHAMAGEAFVNRLTADAAVRLLLMSYDLVAVDRRIQAEEALDAVRGHLHARGIDVELTELVGGVAYVRLHGLETSGVPEAAVRHDLEEALKSGLLGFQEVVLADRRGTGGGAGAGLVQLGGLRTPHRPVYREVLAFRDLPPGRMQPVDVDGASVLVANVGGEAYAVGNHCGESPLPLQFGELSTAELRCSWHGCRYDIRTGMRVDGGEERLVVYPVAVRDGTIQVAVGVEPVAAG